MTDAEFKALRNVLCCVGRYSCENYGQEDVVRCAKCFTSWLERETERSKALSELITEILAALSSSESWSLQGKIMRWARQRKEIMENAK